MDKLFTDPGALATLIAVFLAAILGYFFSKLLEFQSDRRQQLQVTYSTMTETPSIQAESEINANLHVSYQGSEVTDLRFFNVSIKNSGKKPIADFQFLCDFEDTVQPIDSHYPHVITYAPPAIQSDEPLLDLTRSTNNTYFYKLNNFDVGQIIEVNFLFAKSKSSTFAVKFIHPQYKFQRGSISDTPTLEKNLSSALKNLVAFFIVLQIAPIITIALGVIATPILGILFAVFGDSINNFLDNTAAGPVFAVIASTLQQASDLIGLLIGLPFLLRAWRSIRPIIPSIAKKLERGLNT